MAEGEEGEGKREGIGRRDLEREKRAEERPDWKGSQDYGLR